MLFTIGVNELIVFEIMLSLFVVAIDEYKSLSL